MIFGNNKVKVLIILTFLGLTLLLNFQWLHSNHNNTHNLHKNTLLTPNLVNNMSFGYQYAWSQLLWVEAIAYFGEYLDNSDFSYLASRLSLITILNPKAEHAYYMVAAALPWHTQSNKLSAPILKRAMKAFPNDWLWPYYLGFNAYWFDHDHATAASYLLKSASLPNVHYVVSNLALRMQAQNGQFENAVLFLNQQMKSTNDRNLRDQLQRQKNRILTEKVLQDIEKLLFQQHAAPFNSDDIKNLVKAGYTIPSTLPDGGNITFSNEGSIISSHSKKRYKIFIPNSRNKSLKREQG